MDLEVPEGCRLEVRWQGKPEALEDLEEPPASMECTLTKLVLVLNEENEEKRVLRLKCLLGLKRLKRLEIDDTLNAVQPLHLKGLRPFTDLTVEVLYYLPPMINIRGAWPWVMRASRGDRYGCVCISRAPCV